MAILSDSFSCSYSHQISIQKIYILPNPNSNQHVMQLNFQCTLTTQWFNVNSQNRIGGVAQLKSNINANSQNRRKVGISLRQTKKVEIVTTILSDFFLKHIHSKPVHVEHRHSTKSKLESACDATQLPIHTSNRMIQCKPNQM